MAEMTDNLDQDVVNIVGKAIGRSVTAIREGQISPTDRKVAEMMGQLDHDVDNIVGKAIGRSVRAIREGKISPTDRKMTDMLDQDVDNIVGKAIGRSVTAIREGQISPTDRKVAEMMGQLDHDVDNIVVGKAIGRSVTAIREGQTSPTDHRIRCSKEIPITNGTGNDVQTQKVKQTFTTDIDHKMKNPTIVASLQNKVLGKGKKNMLERYLDRILGRDKQKPKKENTELNDSAPSGGSKKRSSKAHNKRDWILKHILCCFVQQTATVEPANH
ncbi:uncharacterized protein LOC132564014 [Ylistrum balloti]|uniref:uncharacterized protein LOC132564014 n=1 Tax=Ylistrum balloti TaxID=509963 RepID=UPI002905F2AD|nr:uncharacterized protein LOC132564014 [Ylistrum balloti]